MSPFLRTTILPVLAALLLGGCSSYQLGSPAELPFETVYVRPARNDTFLPQAQALVSSQVRSDLVRDSRVRIVTSEEDADAVVEITLSEYRRSPGARSSEDTVRAADFDLILQAEVSLYSPGQGRFLFQDRIVQHDVVAYAADPFSGSFSNQQGFNQAEYQAIPRLTRGIARKIADAVLGAW